MFSICHSANAVSSHRLFNPCSTWSHIVPLPCVVRLQWFLLKCSFVHCGAKTMDAFDVQFHTTCVCVTGIPETCRLGPKPVQVCLHSGLNPSQVVLPYGTVMGWFNLTLFSFERAHEAPTFITSPRNISFSPQWNINSWRFMSWNLSSHLHT